MAGPAHDLALDLARAGQIRLVVPELVIRETINKWSEKVTQLERHRTQAISELVAARALRMPRTKQLNVEAAAASEERRLRELLETAEALVPAIPEVPHESVVARALARRRPFDNEGKDGYRDTLLWETVLCLIRDEKDVLLVSNDIRAFGEGSPPVLAGSLALEAASESGRDGAVTLAVDMRRALGELVASSTEIVASVQKLFDDKRFWDEFWDGFYDAAADYPVPVHLVADLFSTRVLSAQIAELGHSGYDSIEILSGRAAPEGDVLVEARLSGEALIRLTFPAADYVGLAGDLLDAEAEDEIATGSAVAHLTLIVAMTVNLDEDELAQVEVSELLDLTRG